MNRRNLRFLRPELLIVLVCAFLPFSACNAVFIGGCTLSNPVPNVHSVTPSTIDPQNLPVTMTVIGSDFQTWSTVQWSSTTLPTTFVDSQHLSVVITSQILNSVTVSNGTGAISVLTTGQTTSNNFNCADGGSSSTFFIFIN
jgi:hypothetical protein